MRTTRVVVFLCSAAASAVPVATAEGHAQASITPGGEAADACGTAPYLLGGPPWFLRGTTSGASDDYDLPSDVSAPTCAAAVTCTGSGASSSLPRGAVYTGTGRGPDVAWRIKVDTSCLLTVRATPRAPWDLALIVYLFNCSSSLGDCACVSDSGGDGESETARFTAIGGTDYFVVIDGYAAAGEAAGPSGRYLLEITGTGCSPQWPMSQE